MSLPPAQPAYVFRGHAAQIHSTAFIKANSRLVTGDADGWIVVWSLATKRATAVWRAHEGAILGSVAWGQNRLITHGKDNKLIVWKLVEEDESIMSTVLPLDDPASSRRHPWLLHVLPVNTLNFCSFAYCKAQGQFEESQSENLVKSEDINELIIAVPNTISSEAVDIFHLPSEKRIFTVSGDKSVNTGMVMAVSIFYHRTSLTVISGYESGHTTVSQQVDGLSWHILYKSQPHSQPVLGLAIAPNLSCYLTSSADAIIAKHPIPAVTYTETAFPNSDLLSSAQTCQPTAGGKSLLSKGLAFAGPARDNGQYIPKISIQTTPLKIVQTKHSGQQGLKIRTDGKIFATAGWDSKVRVYSLQTLKELAVLKWHKEGCYAVAFADVVSTSDADDPAQGGGGEYVRNALENKNLVQRSMTLTVRDKRVLKVTSTHWLAAGSKDGKVSLWDIY